MSAPKDPLGFAAVEPRITQIAQELERLLSVLIPEHNGHPVDVDGFRIRDLSEWAHCEVGSAMNSLTPISSICNAQCEFCFEKGIPFPRDRSLMSYSEACTRLKYYSPKDGTGLFPSSRNHMETFIHPEAVQIIELARQRDSCKQFWVTTNGSYLDEKAIARLSACKPLMIKLSLNSSDEQEHRRLMRLGVRTNIAINAPKLLKQYGLPFVGSIVAWPTLSFGSLERTIRYLEECQAYAVRLRLPLKHRFMKQELACDFEKHWEEVIAFGHQLQQQINVALFVEPPMYYITPLVAEIDGVIMNSPAYKLGLKCGDIIYSINGLPVYTRAHSETLLAQSRLENHPVVLQVDRGGRRLSFKLNDESSPCNSYPYDSKTQYPGENFGICHQDDFRLTYIQEVFDTIRRYASRNVLLFSSPAAASIFEAVINQVPHFARQLESVNLYIETVEANTAGGNFHRLDSRFVDDYAIVIAKRLRQGIPIELILIPDAFGSSWGTDITGKCVAQLSMQFAVPVERIDWPLIYGRDV